MWCWDWGAGATTNYYGLGYLLWQINYSKLLLAVLRCALYALLGRHKRKHQ